MHIFVSYYITMILCSINPANHLSTAQQTNAWRFLKYHYIYYIIEVCSSTGTQTDRRTYEQTYSSTAMSYQCDIVWVPKSDIKCYYDNVYQCNHGENRNLETKWNSETQITKIWDSKWCSFFIFSFDFLGKFWRENGRGQHLRSLWFRASKLKLAH